MEHLHELVNPASCSVRDRCGEVDKSNKLLLYVQNPWVDVGNIDRRASIVSCNIAGNWARETSSAFQPIQVLQGDWSYTHEKCENPTSEVCPRVKMRILSPCDRDQLSLVDSLGWCFLGQAPPLQSETGNQAGGSNLVLLPEQSEQLENSNIIGSKSVCNEFSDSLEEPSRDDMLQRWLQSTALDIGNVSSRFRACDDQYHLSSIGGTGGCGRESGEGKVSSTTILRIKDPNAIGELEGGMLENVLHGQFFRNSSTNFASRYPSRNKLHANVGVCGDAEGVNCMEDVESNGKETNQVQNTQRCILEIVSGSCEIFGP